MPFTANRDFKENPRLFVKGQGVYLWTHKGDQVLDGVSGLFCVAAGHGRPEIRDAVMRQLDTLDYVPHFQFGAPPSFELARRIAAITPGDLNRVFFCNSGSEAVDTALKVALAYHRARGEGTRTRIVGRERAYHGVNFGGMSVGGMVNNRKTFGLGLPGVVHMRHTQLPEHKFVRGQPETGALLADDLQRMVDLHGADTIAACIVEPVAGSIGFLVPPKGYLERLRAICDRHSILLIFDEVICGFGRVGKAFGAQAFGVTPDAMTMAKALTNGAIPMGAVAFREGIYDTIVNSAAPGAIELFHGYTYSAHPVASAAGCATQEIYVQERLFERAAKLSPAFLDAVFSLRELPIVTDIRGYGLLAAIDVAPLGTPGTRGFQIMKQLYEAGLLVKMTGDAILISPPLVSEEKHFDELVAKVKATLQKH
ncbi:MAG: aspartate aminotransferase family protein [Alphaproteobacteria bacterium]|nr:aspartate aminotransferase family protein [Alphaproteobacteria bacterium]